MRNFPLQTIFLNLFASAIIFFFQKHLPANNLFLHFFFFYNVIFFGAKNISAIF